MRTMFIVSSRNEKRIGFEYYFTKLTAYGNGTSVSVALHECCCVFMVHGLYSIDFLLGSLFKYISKITYFSFFHSLHQCDRTSNWKCEPILFAYFRDESLSSEHYRYIDSNKNHHYTIYTSMKREQSITTTTEHSTSPNFSSNFFSFSVLADEWLAFVFAGQTKLWKSMKSQDR